MGLREQILDHYLDDECQVTIDRDPTPGSTGNGQLYHSVFIVRLHQLGQLRPEDRARFAAMCDRSQYLPGLHHRSQHKGAGELNSWDNYLGIAAADAFAKMGPAADIVEHGRRHGWHYNNVDPADHTWQSWHAWRAGLIASYRMGAGREPGCMDLHSLNLAIRGNNSSSDGGSRITGWLMVELCNLQRVLPEACQLWENSVRDRFGGMAGVMRAAFPDHPDHPFIALWEDL